MNANSESFPVSPSLCLGVLGCTGLALHKISCELSILLVCTLGPLLGYGQGPAPPYSCLHHLFKGGQRQSSSLQKHSCQMQMSAPSTLRSEYLWPPGDDKTQGRCRDAWSPEHMKTYHTAQSGPFSNPTCFLRAPPESHVHYPVN